MLRDIDQERRKINLSNNIGKVQKEKPKKFSRNLKRRKYEEEIIRILLNYGNEKISFGDEVISICEFIFNDLKSDNIKIQNEPHNMIYIEIEQLSNSNNCNQSHFTAHRDEHINKLCIDLLSNKHNQRKLGLET